ncbi:Hemerythrin HHE cation binding domain-containing protein [Myxococcus fulvus]|uniref:Hemerythrin HHE cation binding domain-containing protein n=1 Tax=Myxococcus fulvus TaxID=33 RepID=A0A511TDH9_MYXFU|nr:hemerythrin domain-containing protein [Myxococcus fulvus]GEN11228.1 hypothetical protein MFU01_62650 [Myxococcus fulvus]SEU39461.1 Hemerythrin HHE cation binding domain-containing protein [Myxococcus fulvus]
MGGPFDILVEQHRELEERFEDLGAGEDESGSSSVVRELVALLRHHLWLEERCLQPWVTRVEGRARGRQQAGDRQAMHELLDEMEEHPLQSAEWQARFLTLEDLWVAHLQEVESSLLPRLTSVMDPREQQALAQELSRSRLDTRSSASEAGFSGSGPFLDDLRWEG